MLSLQQINVIDDTYTNNINNNKVINNSSTKPMACQYEKRARNNTAIPSYGKEQGQHSRL